MRCYPCRVVKREGAADIFGTDACQSKSALSSPMERNQKTGDIMSSIGCKNIRRPKHVVSYSGFRNRLYWEIGLPHCKFFVSDPFAFCNMWARDREILLENRSLKIKNKEGLQLVVASWL